MRELISTHLSGAALKPSDFSITPTGFEVIPKKAIGRGGMLKLDKNNPTYVKEIAYNKNSSSVVDSDFIVTALRDLVPSGPNIGYLVKDDSIRKYLMAQGVYGFKLNKSLINTGFLLQFSNTSKYRKIMQRILVGSTQVHIRTSDYFRINLFIPALPEQQKIANFLSSVDSWLDNLRSQKRYLDSYKKSIMQKIFSQDIRFKDEKSNDYPEWEKERLCSITSIKTGKKDVSAGSLRGKYRFYTCAREYTFSDSFSFEGEAILIAGNAEVGLCQYYYGKFEAYQRTYVLQNFKISGQYVFRYLSQYFRSYALGLKQSGAMSFIKLGMLNDFIVPIPTQIEQEKISKFLASIDIGLESNQSQIEELELWKKGLMQQMFV